MTHKKIIIYDNIFTEKDKIRFYKKINKTNYCWYWNSTKDKKNYGQFRLKGKTRPAHRISYILFCGTIPKNLQIDHLCRNHSCINPSHLRVVTCKENILCGISFSAKNSKKIKCLRGHLFNKKNTYFTPDGRRDCKKCRKQATIRYLKRKEV